MGKWEPGDAALARYGCVPFVHQSDWVIRSQGHAFQASKAKGSRRSGPPSMEAVPSCDVRLLAALAVAHREPCTPSSPTIAKALKLPKTLLINNSASNDILLVANGEDHVASVCLLRHQRIIVGKKGESSMKVTPTEERKMF